MKFTFIPLPPSDKKSEIVFSIALAAMIFLILWVFQPFGTYNYKSNYKTFFLLGYGIISGGIYFAFTQLKRNKKYLGDGEWSLRKEIIHTILALCATSILLYTYKSIVLHSAFSLVPFLIFVGIVLSVGVFPYSIILLIQYNRYYVIKSTANIKNNSKLVKDKEKHQNKDLAPELEMKIKQKISVIKENELFLNPNLTLGDVAEELSIPKHILSKYLNVTFGKSFTSYINEHRIEKAKQLLLSENKYSIDGLGYNCGFNSKSNFYTTFKKFTGITPAQYRKSKGF